MRLHESLVRWAKDAPEGWMLETNQGHPGQDVPYSLLSGRELARPE